MNSIKKALYLISFTAIIAQLSVANSISKLSDGLQLLAQNNLSIQAQKHQQTAAQYDIKSSRALFFPQIKIELNANHLDRDLTLDLDGIRTTILTLQAQNAGNFASINNALLGNDPLTAAQLAQTQQTAYGQYDQALPHFVDTIKTQNHWLGQIVAYQPIYHGGKIFAAHQIAKAKHQGIVAESLQKSQALQKEYIRYYIQLLLLNKSIPLRKDVLNLLNTHLQNLSKLQNEGIIDRTGKLKVEISISEANIQLADDISKVQTLQLLLQQMTQNSSDISPIENLNQLPNIQIIEQSSTVQNSDQHPILMQLAAKKSQAENYRKVQLSNALPEIGAFGKLELNQNALSALEPNWVVGIKASMMLFKGGANYYNYQSARATEQQVNALTAEAIDAINTHKRRTILLIQQANLKQEQLQTRIALAKEQQRIITSRFEQGLATNSEVLEAHLAYEKAQLENMNLIAEAWLALLEYSAISGDLNLFTQSWEF